MANNLKNNRGNLNDLNGDVNLENEVSASSCRQCFCGTSGNQRCSGQRQCMPQPMPVMPSTSYARYSISTTAVTNATLLPLTLTFTGTTNYSLTSGTTITLPAGCVYKVEYIVQSVLNDVGYLNIAPVINNAVDGTLSTTVNSYTAGTGTFSVSGGFILPATQATTLALEAFTDQTATGALTGTLSIVAVSKILPDCYQF